MRRLTEIDFEHTVALAGFDEAGTILGVVRLAAEADTSRAEFAIALRSDWKGQGLGWVLMHRMIDIAARLGIAEIFGWVLRGNEAMPSQGAPGGGAVAAGEAVPR